jgi:hypothetical protein
MYGFDPGPATPFWSTTGTLEAPEPPTAQELALLRIFDPARFFLGKATLKV